MMRNLTDKQYQAFNSDERFKLTLSALARQDIQEAERLYETSPWRAYEARDMWYMQKMCGAKSIIALFIIEYAHLCNLIMRIESLLYEKEFSEDLSLTGPENQNQWRQRRKEIISRLKGLYAGLTAFCEEVGLNAEEFVATIPINYTCPGAEFYLRDGSQVDLEYAAKSKAIFLECWGS